MPPEALMVLKFVAIFAILFVAAFWLIFPFAILWTMKKRGDEAKEEREALLQEVFWLRKTIETLPGAGTVARRHSVKMMSRFKGTPVPEDAEDEKPKKSVLSEKAAPEVDVDEEEEATLAPPKSKAKAKAKAAPQKTAPALRQKEPKISMPAASLLEEDPDYDDEDDDYDPEFQAKAGAAPEEAFDEDEDDYEDESLDFLDGDKDPSDKMIDLSLMGDSKAKKQAQAMTQRIVVEIPEEDEISEDEEGFFVYRKKRYDSLLDAMKQQQADAQ